MLDHISLPVSDFARSKAFYTSVFASLGGGLLMESEHQGFATAGFGKDGMPTFWIAQGQVAQGIHVALSAVDRAAIDGFYQAALAAGARDNGAPGLRPQYHPNYYGAFVLDPDGYNLEAVSHRPA